jgi:hypothetical protein
VPRELSCRAFVGLIRLLREDELSDIDRRLFQQHRAKCRRCAEYLKGYELTVSAIKGIAKDSRDSGKMMMPESLVRRILAHTSNRRGRLDR